MAQWVKNPPAIQEIQATWVESQGQEDPLKEKMTTYSSILAWRIPWTEEFGELQSMRAQRVGHASAHGIHRILWEWGCARFELVQPLFILLKLWIYHENKLREEERSSERDKSSQMSSCRTSQVPTKLPVDHRSISLAKSIKTGSINIRSTNPVFMTRWKAINNCYFKPLSLGVVCTMTILLQ